MHARCWIISMALTLAAGCAATAGQADGPGAAVTMVDVAPGWAANSVNAVVFRKNALVTHGDTQFIAYYDGAGRVVLGKRRLGARAWELKTTQFSGKAGDAHNAISIMVDGAGYLHLAWDHHNDSLRYARGVAPGSLDMGSKQPMLGSDESAVTYPEFYRLPNGNLLFLYRNGASGQGNLVMNRYDVGTGAWSRLHSNLISGEGRRSAYWQAFLDHRGTLHLSWVWRESPDVASNHDMAYARSRDGGVTWETARGAPYALPVTAASADYAARIPQNSELINQTSMAADGAGNPYIASYWRTPDSPVPQYRVLYFRDGAWAQLNLDFRHAPFSLGGVGTKAIPVARPQIMLSWNSAAPARPAGLLVFRDEERGSKVSAAVIDDFAAGRFRVTDLDGAGVGAWEPSFDSELWREKGELNLFVQPVRQVDGEGLSDAAPSMIRVLQWKPAF